MSRTEELLSIGMFRICDIAIILNLHKDSVSYRIKRLGIIAFEKWWYDEYQLEIIKNNKTEL